MNKELKNMLVTALQGNPVANFSTDQVNESVINAICEACGIDTSVSYREFKQHEAKVFALIEEAVEAILPQKIQNNLGQFTEVKTFARDAEVVFNIEKIGKARAKLTIAKGARGGIYRAARLDAKQFQVPTDVYTAGIYVTLEDILLGTVTLAELFANIVEGFEEVVYKEIFNALSAGAPAVGGSNKVTTPLADLDDAIDSIIPTVKQYGKPVIFGAYQALCNLYNPATQTNINLDDAKDIRQYGFIQNYKGNAIVELPNYLVNEVTDEWFYDPKFVFVMPAGAKPVKVAFKGDLTIVKHALPTGGERWEAHRLMGVGLAMANNYAIIEINDLD